MDWTRNRLAAGSLAALLALGLLAGCGNGDDDGGGDTAAETTAAEESSDGGGDTSTTSSGGGAESGDAVTIKGFKFGPAELSATAGTEVTWTNDDGAAHTVTADDGPDGFESDDLSSGDTFSFTFEEAGTYEYHCEIHPTMTASVTVE
jgi:plastocyanin